MANNSLHNLTHNISGEVKQGELTGSIIPALMFGGGVFGNVLALVVLARSPQSHRRSIFYRMVGGLAITDLFGTLATSPVVLIVYENDYQWIGGQPLCDYFSFIMIFAGFATVFIVGVMALDRYIAILHPFFYEAHFQPKKAPRFIFVAWLVAFAIACLPLVGVGENIIHYPGTWCFFNFNGQSSADEAFSYIYAGTGLICLVSTAIWNVMVITVLFKMRRHFSSTNIASGASNQICSKQELQMSIFLVVIVIVFGVCWGPLLIRIIINQSAPSLRNKHADLLAIRLASFHQICDPWVYILLRTKSIIRIIQLPKTIANSIRIERFDTSKANEYGIRKNTDKDQCLKILKCGSGEEPNNGEILNCQELPLSRKTLQKCNPLCCFSDERHVCPKKNEKAARNSDEVCLCPECNAQNIEAINETKI
ncbi:hypothetical protein ScPMuIL_005251 [Solemya velum]